MEIIIIIESKQMHPIYSLQSNYDIHQILVI